MDTMQEWEESKLWSPQHCICYICGKQIKSQIAVIDKNTNQKCHVGCFELELAKRSTTPKDWRGEG